MPAGADGCPARVQWGREFPCPIASKPRRGLPGGRLSSHHLIGGAYLKRAENVPAGTPGAAHI